MDSKRAWLLTAGCWLAGCGPWITTIPTYWPYEDEGRGPPETPASEPVVADVPAAEQLAVEAEEEELPPPDAPQCTSIYVVTAQMGLFAFEPRAKGFERRGILRCPATPRSTPFSMAVARSGVAHVLYNDGRLYRVNVLDAACEATPFAPNQPPGFALFGMGYAAHHEAKGETLYVTQIPPAGPSKGLARIDTDSYQLSYIGPFSENHGGSMELTPSGDGPLYGYAINEPGPGGTLMRIDPDDASIEEAIPLEVGTRSTALAVAWWGGAFYLFTTLPPRRTLVTRYDPKSGETEEVTTLKETVVGAGVSTCAPSE